MSHLLTLKVHTCSCVHAVCGDMPLRATPSITMLQLCKHKHKSTMPAAQHKQKAGSNTSRCPGSSQAGKHPPAYHALSMVLGALAVRALRHQGVAGRAGRGAWQSTLHLPSWAGPLPAPGVSVLQPHPGPKAPSLCFLSTPQPVRDWRWEGQEWTSTVRGCHRVHGVTPWFCLAGRHLEAVALALGDGVTAHPRASSSLSLPRTAWCRSCRHAGLHGPAEPGAGPASGQDGETSTPTSSPELSSTTATPGHAAAPAPTTGLPGTQASSGAACG